MPAPSSTQTPPFSATPYRIHLVECLDQGAGVRCWSRHRTLGAALDEAERSGIGGWIANVATRQIHARGYGWHEPHNTALIEYLEAQT